MQEGELTLKLLNLFLDALTKFPGLEGVLAPFFHELVSKTLARLHNSTAKEGYLDLLLALFRAISVRTPCICHLCLQFSTVACSLYDSCNLLLPTLSNEALFRA